MNARYSTLTAQSFLYERFYQIEERRCNGVPRRRNSRSSEKSCCEKRFSRRDGRRHCERCGTRKRNGVPVLPLQTGCLPCCLKIRHRADVLRPGRRSEQGCYCRSKNESTHRREARVL